MSVMQPVRLADSTMLSRPGLSRPPFSFEPNPEWTAGFTKDELMTFDASTKFTIDSTGAFLKGELEKMDPQIHEPLAAVTWARDVDLREDVTDADEYSSFTISSFASPGGITPAGKAWIGKESTAITGIGLDIGKITNPLIPWGIELKWTLLELASAAKTGRPIDSQMFDGMKLKYQMDVDEMVYLGDSGFAKYGLFNSPLVTPANVAAGSGSGSPLTWCTATGAGTKTADEILQDVNGLLDRTWRASGLAIVPSELRLPPTQYTYIVSNKVSDAGNVSILEFLRNNSICNATNGRPLNIQPVKHLTAGGATTVNRMVCYTKDRDRVRMPLVPLQHTPVEYRSMWQLTTYYARLGCLEIVYPECIGYADAI